MRRYELHPVTYYCCYITLWKSKHRKCNITALQEITKGNCITCVTASSKWTRSLCALNLLIWGVIVQCVYETIHDVDDLKKTLDANFLWLWPGHCRCYDWPVAWPTEIMCACWWWTLWTRSDINVHLCDFSEHLWNCQCNLMYVTAIL